MRWLFAFLLLVFCGSAEAANRFWNPYSITGAVSGTGGVCRLTITPAITGSGLLAGDTVISTGITGITGCNVTATISTVVDSTHVELTGTTFGGAGFGGTACLAGGNWTATNTSNWHTASSATCGLGGATVPTSSDVPFFNANSKGGTVTLNFGGTINLAGLDLSNFAGTWDNSVNNNNILMTGTYGWAGGGSSTRTLKLGTATYTFAESGTATFGLNFSSSSNLTLVGGSSTVAYTPDTSTGQRPIDNGGSAVSGWGTLSLGGTGVGNMPGFYQFTGSTQTWATITVAPGIIVLFGSGSTLTVTNALSWNGTASRPIFLQSSNNGVVSTVAAAVGSTVTYASMRALAANTSGRITASNTFDNGLNTNVTFATGGSGACIIGGWLLWRDMPEHLNDNFPAWLEKTG